MRATNLVKTGSKSEEETKPVWLISFLQWEARCTPVILLYSICLSTTTTTPLAARNNTLTRAPSPSTRFCTKLHRIWNQEKEELERQKETTRESTSVRRSKRSDQSTETKKQNGVRIPPKSNKNAMETNEASCETSRLLLSLSLSL